MSLFCSVLYISVFYVSQNNQAQKSQSLGDPPQIYLSDPSSLTSLIPLTPGECVVNPSQHVFVVIKPPSVGQSKESSLSAEEDLLEIVSLEDKADVEVNRHVTVNS